MTSSPLAVFDIDSLLLDEERAIRDTVRPKAGAMFQPAVLNPKVSAVAFGSSSIITMTKRGSSIGKTPAKLVTFSDRL